MKILKWLFLLPLFLIFLGFICTELNKAFWDYKVKKMCEKDGGVMVFEEVQLSRNVHREIISDRDVLMIPHKSNVKNNSPFYIDGSTKKLRFRFPEIRKYEDFIVDRKYGKILGKRIIYSRVGGDFPIIIAHPSSFSCRNIKGINTNLPNSIFTIQG